MVSVAFIHVFAHAHQRLGAHFSMSVTMQKRLYMYLFCILSSPVNIMHCCYHSDDLRCRRKFTSEGHVVSMRQCVYSESLVWVCRWCSKKRSRTASFCAPLLQQPKKNTLYVVDSYVWKSIKGESYFSAKVLRWKCCIIWCRWPDNHSGVLFHFHF